jgi:hypothetical protein
MGYTNLDNKIFNIHYNKNDLRQHSFNNSYILNLLLKWLSSIIVILRMFLIIVCNKKILFS